MYLVDVADGDGWEEDLRERHRCRMDGGHHGAESWVHVVKHRGLFKMLVGMESWFEIRMLFTCCFLMHWTWEVVL